jgi:glycosyltransferase involved in cell wall biosynthesis
MIERKVMDRQKKVCIAFLGNALHDSRIVNLSNSLKNDNCQVSVIAFDWFISSKNYSDETFLVFKLTKSKIRIFFYLKFALILIRELIKAKVGIYFAEDLYTLPFVATIAKFKKSKVMYNSRELYAFLGGLRNRPIIQSLIRNIESYFIRRVDVVLTTGEMDSQFIEKYYAIKDTVVIRNIPLFQKPKQKIDFRKMFGIGSDKVILLYQGVLLNGRGMPQILRAVAKLLSTNLVVVGEGEQREYFKRLAEELKISDRVFFTGSIDQKELINYTAGADIGLCLIENISVSYFHALPNKLFEYIMAGIPVLVSDLPQMKKIVEKYKVGESINISIEGNITSTLERWIDDPDLLETFRKNCVLASQELNWQEEYRKTRNILLDLKKHD